MVPPTPHIASNRTGIAPTAKASATMDRTYVHTIPAIAQAWRCAGMPGLTWINKKARPAGLGAIAGRVSNAGLTDESPARVH